METKAPSGFEGFNAENLGRLGAADRFSESVDTQPQAHNEENPPGQLLTQLDMLSNISGETYSKKRLQDILSTNDETIRLKLRAIEGKTSTIFAMPNGAEKYQAIEELFSEIEDLTYEN
jgi:hypothetical protein